MRLLIVSNRLPFTVVEKDGKVAFEASSGGLVSGLSAYLDSFCKNPDNQYVWIGWPGGSEMSESTQSEWKKKLAHEGKFYPVFLSEKVMDNFYHGFCNKTIWPLFHYFPSYASYDDECWADYEAVNQKFCDAVCEVAQPGDTVWIHDYHLMLLPKMLRERRPDLSISFFLHIPFPSYEIFRLLPAKWRVAILEGLLGSDVVGFHTNDFTQYFLRCCLRLLGHEHSMGQIQLQGRLVLADTFPMGIDYRKYHESAASEEVSSEVERLKANFRDMKLILSVDRLDYSKGILKRLLGFEKFLELQPEWHQKVVLALILVPSRIAVDQYQEMKKQIDEAIGKINGKFGKLGWTPIFYQYKSLPLTELSALYRASDVALVTPLRDGMNLVAKEFVASRIDQKGMLILSEMAGASREMGEAIIINPTTSTEVAEAIKLSLEMPEEEQVRRNQALQKRLQQYDVVRWAEDNMQKLADIHEEQEKFYSKRLKDSAKAEIIQKYHQSRRRILFFDYDGTLVPLSRFPALVKPSQELLSTLMKISSQKGTELVIVSGRPREFLAQCFEGLPVHLIAEHGVWVKKWGKDWKLIKALVSDWKSQISPILRVASDRLPGSFIEEKEYSLVWHYRNTDPELSEVRKKEVMDDLINFTATAELQIMQGHKVIEVRSAGVSKGHGALQFLASNDYAFVAAIGDDITDEELFKALPQKAYSFRVGVTNTYAQFNLLGHQDVIRFIESLAQENP